MAVSDDDWRLKAQENYLQGATLQRKRYRAWSETWEHDECDFCQTKFMDPEFSLEHAEFITSHPDVLTVGFAVQGRSPQDGTLDDYWWVCPTCVDDFRDRFNWTIVDSDPPPLSRTSPSPE